MTNTKFQAQLSAAFAALLSAAAMISMSVGPAAQSAASLIV